MFMIIDSQVKIFGVFAGHGPHGNLVSTFVSSFMFDYVKRKMNKKNLEGKTRSDVKRLLRHAFKDVQNILKGKQVEFLAKQRAEHEEKQQLQLAIPSSVEASEEDDSEPDNYEIPLQPKQSAAPEVKAILEEAEGDDSENDDNEDAPSRVDVTPQKEKIEVEDMGEGDEEGEDE